MRLAALIPPLQGNWVFTRDDYTQEQESHSGFEKVCFAYDQCQQAVSAYRV